MSLEEVHHQGFAQRLLRRALDGDRMPHAYLFHGPDGVGKETLARGLARLLLCGSPIERDIERDRIDLMGIDRVKIGCGSCEDCRSVRAKTHPDLHIIYRQLSRQHPEPEVRRRKALDIGVDVVRHFVIDRVALTPHRGRAKVFIIREADRITPGAQNALLKTLEEPPATTFLILLVASLDRLLPTTLSRCQTVRFDRLPATFVEQRLSSAHPDLSKERIAWYAQWGSGSLGPALQAIEDDLYAVNDHVLEKLEATGGASGGGDSRGRDGSGAGHSQLIKVLTEQAKAVGEHFRRRDPDITDTEATRRGLKAVMKMAAVWYGDVLRVGSGGDAPPANPARAEKIHAAAKALTPDSAIEAIHRIARAERHLDLNANTQLVIETLVNDLVDGTRGEGLTAVSWVSGS